MDHSDIQNKTMKMNIFIVRLISVCDVSLIMLNDNIVRPAEQRIIQRNNPAIKNIEIHLTSTRKNEIRNHSDEVQLLPRELELNLNLEKN